MTPAPFPRSMTAARLNGGMRGLLAAIGLTLAAVSLPAMAQSLRCHGDLASIGDSKASVLQKCGEPLLKDQFCRPVTDSVNNRTYGSTGSGGGSSSSSSANITINSCQPVEEWTYNPGYGQFMTMLQFESGQIKVIRYGERVTR